MLAVKEKVALLALRAVTVPEPSARLRAAQLAQPARPLPTPPSGWLASLAQPCKTQPRPWPVKGGLCWLGGRRGRTARVHVCQKLNGLAGILANNPMQPFRMLPFRMQPHRYRLQYAACRWRRCEVARPRP